MTAVHHGHAIKTIREMLKIKQSTLAEELGYTQQNLSRLEGTADIDKETLELISKALNVPVEAIENFNPEKVIQIITTSFTNNNQGEGSAFYQHSPTFQVAEKAFDLYERMLGDLKIDKLRLENELERMKTEKAAKEGEVLKLQIELERLRKNKT